MTRIVSIFLPFWPTDRLRQGLRQGQGQGQGTPLVLAARMGGRRLLTAADARAQALGLRTGMAVTKAQALVPGLAVEPADPQADAEALERLALWLLQRVAPIVAVDGADGIVIDSTGADHLHGGEAALLTALAGRLAASGVTARVAVADSWGAAHALARFATAAMQPEGGTDAALPGVPHVAQATASPGMASGAQPSGPQPTAQPIPPPLIAPSGAARSLLAPLPLEALRLPPAIPARLRDLGFAHIGDLLDQPRAPLARRFGPELYRRLDQALGLAADPIQPIRLPDPVATRRAFAEPIAAAETIARHIASLTAELCDRLERRGLGARRLDLICHRVDAHQQALRIGLAAPQRDPQRLTRLLCDRIETIAPGFGIEILTLTATWAEPLAPRQASSLTEAVPDLTGLIDTLANRIGAAAIYRLAPVASDVPERSQRRIPPLAPPTGAGWPAHWPRPARLLPRPEPIETLALLPDHPPHWFSWRGTRHLVRHADGPERIFGEWWKREAEMAAVRDYFRIEDEAGARFWIFRAGDGEDAATGSHRWFLHGVFGC